MPNYMTELSPDNNAHVYQIKDKEAAPITLLKDTVGWVGKNKAPVHIDNIKSLNSSVGTWSGNVYTRNDLTFTFDVNKDGYVTRITLSGTASANTTVELLTLTGAQIKALGSSLVLSGGITSNAYLILRKSDWTNVARSNGSDSNAFNTASLEDATTYYLSAPVTSGTNTSGFVYYPMLRDTSIIDSTFEPYHESVEQCKFDRAEQRVLGAKNLLKYPYGNTTKTENNVTFTDNGDGTITANTSAAASANTSFMLAMAFVYGLDKDAFLSGIPSGISSAISDILLWDETASKGYYDNGNGVLIPASISGHIVNIAFRVKSGQTVSNLTIKPMLRLASDPDDTYVPYAMTNREMTAIAQPNDGVLQVGKLVVLHKAFTTNDALSGGAWNNNRTDIVFPAPIKNIPVRAFVSGSGFADLMLGESGNNLFSATAINADKTIYITCAYISK